MDQNKNSNNSFKIRKICDVKNPQDILKCGGIIDQWSEYYANNFEIFHGNSEFLARPENSLIINFRGNQ
ncbi:hypothetical protein Glove_431g15 [Diversispora epigaea]|uniref:Uncharacterized protein n=1 Tax=Diversispora epigaea TaxID=1348612 RepID=A0A397GWK6_9GLOM|nr:hypothetical protein Glove_431g15 [Diversispora epigaea]